MNRMPKPEQDGATRAWTGIACFMLAVIVVLLPAAVYDLRTLDGVGVWNKPLKFALALIVHFITLAVLAQLLPSGIRNGQRMSRIVMLSVTAALFEIAYIVFQAARGRHSHFNFDTPFETGMYALMGVGATYLAIVPFILGRLILREEGGDRSGFRLGAITGLLLAPVLTLVVAGYMSGVAYDRWVGVPGTGEGLPFFGWSREVGDFRPSHFTGLHAMQILPLVGLAGDRFAPSVARKAVWFCAAIIVVMTVALFVQALAGRPVWPL